MRTKFFICRHCGNIIEMVHSAGVPVMCCGEKMQELVPNTVEASNEKHLPVVTVDGSTVTVAIGSVAHPMTDEHFIQWIALETKNGIQRRILTPQDAPQAVFELAKDDAPLSAVAYCNLHGLWATEI